MKMNEATLTVCFREREKRVLTMAACMVPIDYCNELDSETFFYVDTSLNQDTIQGPSYRENHINQPPN